MRRSSLLGRDIALKVVLVKVFSAHLISKLGLYQWIT